MPDQLKRKKNEQDGMIKSLPCLFVFIVFRHFFKDTHLIR